MSRAGDSGIERLAVLPLANFTNDSSQDFFVQGVHDALISELQQAGLSSSYSRPGRLSFHEPVVRDIANWVLDRVLDERANGGAA